MGRKERGVIMLDKLLLLSLLVAKAEDCEPSNMKQLRDVQQYFSTQPFTSCSYNGFQVDCAKLVEYKAKLKVDKSKDPNESRMP